MSSPGKRTPISYLIVNGQLWKHLHTNNIKQGKCAVFMYLGVCVLSLCVCVYVSKCLKIILKRREHEFGRELEVGIYGWVFKKKGVQFQNLPKI